MVERLITLHGLTRDKQAPAILAKTNSHGVLTYAVMLSSSFLLLVFLNVTTFSATVFRYFVSLSTVPGLVNWINILISYFCFVEGSKARTFHVPTCHGQEFSILMALIPKFDVVTFITPYPRVVVYVAINVA
ncbi:Uncharacterized protein HZ326_22081 [Fusarium oxysporum f. sp. albedinis]|nr:Uncharacterized protein HZ326_27110 [Fusarium oxysporum f. sp. albedinis]KAJ0134876.1 Uncharacterized protein HZ326_22081 [Fusarium oxysporum f. sp. albedinis]